MPPEGSPFNSDEIPYDYGSYFILNSLSSKIRWLSAQYCSINFSFDFEIEVNGEIQLNIIQM